jgi:hypothetical protein
LLPRMALATDGWLGVLMFVTGAALFYYGRPHFPPYTDMPYYYIPQIASFPLLAASLVRHGRLRHWAFRPGWQVSLSAAGILLLLGCTVGIGTRVSGYTIHYEENLGQPTRRGEFYRDLHKLAHDLDDCRHQGVHFARLPDFNVNESILAEGSIYESSGCTPHPLSSYCHSLARSVAQEDFWQSASERDTTVLVGHPAEWFYRKYYPRCYR